MKYEGIVEREAIKVKKINAERTRRKLMEYQILDSFLKISSDHEFVYFPMREGVTKVEIIQVLEKCKPVDVDFEIRIFVKKAITRSGDYRNHLKDFPENLNKYLPSSFDVVGDLCIIKIHESILHHRTGIAKAILDSHSHLKGVFLDTGVAGPYRVRNIKHIGGETRTRTVHREYGILLNIDISKVYFSPRLAVERNRIAQIVEEEEKVERILDMFSGIGPFSIHIAKSNPCSMVYAIDSNPDAFQLMQENITFNKISNVVPNLGDAQDVVLKLGNEINFDRIIMNLPHRSMAFLDSALTVITDGTIHIYTIQTRESLKTTQESIHSKAYDHGKTIYDLSTNEIKGYSPTEGFFVHDVTVKKNC